MWIGKIIGAFIGLMRGGFVGFVFGLIVGHMFDKFIAKKVAGKTMDSTRAKELFFSATFRFMGRLAKADGRVCENEISVAEAVMARMGLQGERRKVAISYFTEGKDAVGNLEADLHQLRTVFMLHPELSQVFFEIQLSVAFADGDLSAEESRLFDDACQILGISKLQFNIIQARVWAAMNGQRRQEQGQSSNTQSELANAYDMLGVDANVTDAELKKAYRRLINQHHPDKLVSKGLPDDMMELAKEKAQQIQNAYDLIWDTRKKKR